LNKLNITYHPDYDIPVPTNHRFVGSKFSDLFDYLQKQSYFSHCEITQPQKANEVRLQRSQSSYYIKKVKEDNLSKEDIRKINLPWSNRLKERSFLAIEGTLNAAKLALQTGIACHVGGGTHHAHHSHGYGFCVFNDLAYTAINLIEESNVRKIYFNFRSGCSSR
jgi:acetoin utilization deacetylase AcuC-like enzyme